MPDVPGCGPIWPELSFLYLPLLAVMGVKPKPLPGYVVYGALQAGEPGMIPDRHL